MRKILYCKYTNDRSEYFKIKTSIVDEEGKKKIEKSNSSINSRTHIEKIYDNYLLLKETNKYDDISINRAVLKDDKVEFEFLEGKTVTEQLNQYIKDNDINSIKGILEVYKRTLTLGQQEENFEVTPEFEKIFGHIIFEETMESVKINNIDLSFDNIIINNGFNICDYEWIFEFPIPLKYIIYRTLKYYLAKLKDNTSLSLNLWDYMSIKDEDKIVFEQMECAFYNYVRQDYVPIRELSELWGFNQPDYSLQEMLDSVSKQTNEQSYQVFYDYGNDFSEENSYKNSYKDSEAKGMIIRIPLNGTEKRVRFDPSNRDSVIRIQYMYVYEGGRTYQPNFISNANYSKHNMLYFATDDAQIIFTDIDYKCANYIEIKVDIEYLSKETIYMLVEEAENLEILKKDLNDKIIMCSEKNIEYQFAIHENKNILAENERLKTEINNSKENEKQLLESLENEYAKIDIQLKHQEDLNNLIDNMQIEISQLKEIKSNQIKNIEQVNNVVNEQEQLIESIYNTKAWKLAEKLRGMRNLIRNIF